MIAVLSPAKKLNEKASYPEDLPFTQPVFIDKAETLVKRLQKYTPEQLKDLMKISDNLAALNYERYREWSPEGAYPAIYLYAGDTYKGLDIGSYPEEKLPALQDKVRIISGLYGLLKPLDLIAPYRLEMKTPLAVGNKKDLYAFWKDDITEQLNRELQGRPLVILASKEYASAIDKDKINGPVIEIDFKDNRNGKLRTIGLFAKKARGAMARWIAENTIENPEDLKKFTGLGYRFSPELSTDKKFVFVR